jgi:hypothetical protein
MMTNLLRFDFNDRDGIFEVIENGDWVRATDYDALAAKLATPLDDPRVLALVEAAEGVEGRFYQAAKAFHNTQFWSDEEQDGQPLDDWVFSPIRAALSALEENK